MSFQTRKNPPAILRMLPIFAVVFSLFLMPTCGKHEHKHKHTTTPSGPMPEGSVHDLSLTFQDSKEQTTNIKKISGDRPIILSLLYTSCRSICPIQAGNMLQIQSKLTPEQRKRTQFVILTFDSKDTSADLAKFAQRLRLKDNWTLIRGTKDAVREFAAALGFQYRRNPDGGFSHSATIYLVNKKGKILYKHDGTTAATREFVHRLAALH